MSAVFMNGNKNQLDEFPQILLRSPSRADVAAKARQEGGGALFFKNKPQGLPRRLSCAARSFAQGRQING